eukprot:7204509-Pyramimonas_sp.AAC.1
MAHNVTSFYGSSCANSGKDALKKIYEHRHKKRLGLDINIEPLIQPFTAGEFNSPPNLSPFPEPYLVEGQQ